MRTDRFDLVCFVLTKGSLDLDPVVDFPESSWPADSKINPAGLRSAAYLNSLIRLAQIAGFALQTIVRYLCLVPR